MSPRKPQTAKPKKRKATKRVVEPVKPVKPVKSVRPAKGTKKPAQAAKPKTQKTKANKTKRPTRTTQKAKKTTGRRVLFWLKVAAGVVAAIVVTLIVLSFTDVFKIENVEIQDTAHIQAQDIANLADIPDNANLLNIDAVRISTNLKKNPWVYSVELVRIFPHTLQVVVHEQTIAALVPMSETQTVWAMAPNKSWIQPVDVSSENDDSITNAALKLALADNAFVITGEDSTISPKAGDVTDNEQIEAAFECQENFSDTLKNQVIQYDVPNTDSITVTLKSGVEIALGSTAQLDTKEAVVNQLLEKYPAQITYINVRNPAKPAYKKVAGSALSQGSGVGGGN